MSSKTRKLIWSVPLVATLAIVGALAAFVALGLPNADPAQAQTGGEFITDPGPPLTVATTLGNGRIRVTWENPDTEMGDPTLNGYVVQYAKVDNASSAIPTTASAWTNSKVVGFNDRSHSVTGLENGDHYWFRVAGVLTNADGTVSDTSENFGNSAAATSPEATNPGKPSITIVQNGDNSIKVDWSAPSDTGGSTITGYVAQFRRAANQTGDFDDDPSNPDTTETDASDWIPGVSAFVSSDEGLPTDLGVLMRLPATTKSVTWGSLVKGVKYEVRVYALNTAQTAAETVSQSDLTDLVNEGMADITLAEAADISMLTFDAEITSDSSTSSGAPQLTVEFKSLASGLPVGSSIVLYLEDDFQEPDSIPASSVFFVADRDRTEKTGSGASVYAVNAPRIKTGAYFDEDKKDIAIQVLIPDLCTTDTNECSGLNGPNGTQRFRMIILNTSGIKNPPNRVRTAFTLTCWGRRTPSPLPPTCGGATICCGMTRQSRQWRPRPKSRCRTWTTRAATR